MRYETTRQPMLFLDSRADPKARQTLLGSTPESFAPTAGAGVAYIPQLRDPLRSRTVSPLADMPLKETCGFCGRTDRAPGHAIPDYDELGAFCNQDCADRRLRLYLEETPD